MTVKLVRRERQASSLDGVCVSHRICPKVIINTGITIMEPDPYKSYEHYA